jgi:hypothetical protein
LCKPVRNPRPLGQGRFKVFLVELQGILASIHTTEQGALNAAAVWAGGFEATGTKLFPLVKGSRKHSYRWEKDLGDGNRWGPTLIEIRSFELTEDKT